MINWNAGVINAAKYSMNTEKGIRSDMDSCNGDYKLVTHTKRYNSSSDGIHRLEFF